MIMEPVHVDFAMVVRNWQWKDRQLIGLKDDVMPNVENGQVWAFVMEMRHRVALCRVEKTAIQDNLRILDMIPFDRFIYITDTINMNHPVAIDADCDSRNFLDTIFDKLQQHS